jgi:hypothetical protein
MTEEIRPFDWWMLVIEATVLLFVGYEVGLTIFHQVTGASRKKAIREIEARLRDFIASGEAIRDQAPEGAQAYNAEWVESVKTWIADTDSYVAAKSGRAAVEFRRTPALDVRQRQRITRWGQISYLSGSMGDSLQLLNLKIENLYRIAQRCEDYF